MKSILEKRGRVVHCVALVEDDVQIRRRLESALKNHTELDIVGSVGSCAEARDLLSKRLPDVMLIDLGLPDGNGLDLIREISSHSPSVRILVITVFGDEQTVISAISAGATGYLLKTTPPQQVAESVQMVLDGGSPISPAAANFVLRRLKETVPAQPEGKPTPLLTVKEREILQSIAKGFTYAEIAHVQEITVNTVAFHIKNIYQKLAVRSRAEAVYEAAELGLINVGSASRGDRHRE